MRKIIYLITILSLLIPRIVFAQIPPIIPEPQSLGFNNSEWHLNGTDLENNIEITEKGTKYNVRIIYAAPISGEIICTESNPIAYGQPIEKNLGKYNIYFYQGVGAENEEKFPSRPIDPDGTVRSNYPGSYYAALNTTTNKVEKIYYQTADIGTQCYLKRNGANAFYLGVVNPRDNNWFAYYLKYTTTRVLPANLAKAPTTDQSCEAKLNQLIEKTNSLRNMLIKLAENQDSRYYRDKNIVEKLSEDQNTYWTLLRTTTGAVGFAGFGFLNRLRKQYFPDQVFETQLLTPFGAEWVGQAKNLSIEIDTLLKDVDANCEDVKKNFPGASLVSPDSPNPEKITTWDDFKKQVESTLLATSNALANMPGQKDEGLMAGILRNLTCWFRNFFLTVLHFIANIGAAALTRNY